MFSKAAVAAAAAFSLIASTAATYDVSSPANLAVYWGAAGGQMELGYYCNQSTIDVINVAFIQPFPQQNGAIPGENFGNQCWATPTYPGSDGTMPENCPLLQDDLPYCQKVANKKIVLSIGGGTDTYQLTGQQAGIDFATMLWQMYGPYNASYVAAGGIRPLDRSSTNANLDPFYQIDVDGFDFDIEVKTTDEGLGYIWMIKTLRSLFATNPCKTYLITGAPQCSVPDAIMDTMIQEAEFDALYVQFYNTPACSARNWVSTGRLTYDSWVNRTSFGASKNAKIYLGLLGSPAGSSSAPGDFLSPAEATDLIDTYAKDTRFGGVMLWDATYANGEEVSYNGFSGNYYNFIKSVLTPFAPKTTAAIAPLCPSTTSSSSSASKTSTTTSKTSTSSQTSTTTTSKSSTTSTSSKSSTSTTSKTSSASSTSTTSTSVSSTTSKISSSSLVSSTSSKASTSSSSSTSSKPTTSSTSSSSSSVSLKSSASQSSSSASSSTSISSTSSSSVTSAISVPTSLPSSCQFLGCWTEGADGTRALPSNYTINHTLMSKEICYDFCVTQNGYSHFGLEYAGECWCGDALATSSTNTDDSACSLPCSGTPDELCGGNDVLDVYVCGTGSQTSTSSSSQSTASPTSSTASVTSQSSSSVTPTSISSSAESSTSSSETSTSSSLGVSTSESSSTPSVTPTSSLSSSSLSSSQSSTYSSVGISNSSSSVPVTTSSVSSSTPSVTATSVYSNSSVSSSQSSTYSSAGFTNSSSLVPTSTKTKPSKPCKPSTSKSVVLSTGYTSSSGFPITSSGTATPSFTNSSVIVSPTGKPSGSSSGSGGVSTPSSSSPQGVSTGLSSATSESSGITSTPSSSATGKSSGVVVPSSSTTQYTTSTVRETKTYTITSCASTVTNCPARIGQVTTETIDLYTTICPVTATESRGGETKSTSSPAGAAGPTKTGGSGGEEATSTPFASAGPSVTPMTTSTVYSTKVYTITSCAPTVTNCPAKIGSVTTEIISLYTTVCPVAEATATSTPSVPGGVNQQSPSPSAGVSESAGASELPPSTTTMSSTTTAYRTVKVIKSTATVVPTAMAPYPTGSASASSSGVAGTGTGLPSVSLVIISPVPSVVAEESTSATSGATASETSSPATFTGAASRVGGGSMVAVVLAAVVALII